MALFQNMFGARSIVGRIVEIGGELVSESQRFYRDEDREEWVISRTHLESRLTHCPHGHPAVLYSDGHREFWVNGNLHREDGPAIIWSDVRVHGIDDGIRRFPGPGFFAEPRRLAVEHPRDIFAGVRCHDCAGVLRLPELTSRIQTGIQQNALTST